MPAGLCAQEKACKQEERLVNRLQEIKLDATLVGVMCYQANLLLDMGPSSGLGFGIHPESIPMQTFGKFLFLSVISFDTDLAFTVGMRALRLPFLEGLTDTSAKSLASDQQQEVEPCGGGDPRTLSSHTMSRFPRWFTLGHIEAQQCALASTMLIAAKGKKGYCNFIHVQFSNLLLYDEQVIS
jgi:hypothetical protein